MSPPLSMHMGYNFTMTQLVNMLGNDILIIQPPCRSTNGNGVRVVCCLK